MESSLESLSRKGVVLLCLSLLAPLGAQETGAEKPSPPTVEKLVEALGGPTFAEREQAEAALRRLGEEARGALETRRDSTDPEVRWRVNRLLEDLGPGTSGSGSAPPRPDLGELLQPPRRRPSAPPREQAEVEDFFRELRDLKPRGDLRDLEPRPPTGRRPAEPQEVEELFRDLRQLEEDLWSWELGPRGRQGRLEREMNDLQRPWSELLQEFVDQLWGDEPGLTSPLPRVVAPPTTEGPRLGVLVAPPGEALQAQLQLDPGLGLLVEAVQEGSIAERAGVEQFDVIMGINNVTVTRAQVLLDQLQRMDPGAQGKLTVIRQARQVQLAFRRDEEKR